MKYKVFLGIVVFLTVLLSGCVSEKNIEPKVTVTGFRWTTPEYNSNPTFNNPNPYQIDLIVDYPRSGVDTVQIHVTMGLNQEEVIHESFVPTNMKYTLNGQYIPASARGLIKVPVYVSVWSNGRAYSNLAVIDIDTSSI